MNLKNHPIDHFVMNAAGTCKNLNDVMMLCEVEDISAILLGSITKQARPGNSGNVYFSQTFGTLNSLGMNNNGIDHYATVLGTMAAKVHEKGKRFGVSVAAIENMQEYAFLADICIEKGADFIELNGGCPNVWNHGTQHRILTFDLKACEQIFTSVQKHVSRDTDIYLKVSPISDPVYLQELASLINAFPGIKGVTATNTFPNGHERDTKGNQVISVGKGLAGVSGAALKLISKGQVLQWKQCLAPDKEVIAAGGIDCGKDILDYAANEATKFQIGTAYLDKGAGIFAEVLADAGIPKENVLTT